jgi:hypothetical protein
MGFFGNDDFFGGDIEDLFNKIANDGFFEYSTVDADGNKKVIRRRKSGIISKALLNKVVLSNKVYLLFDLSSHRNIKVKLNKESSEHHYNKRYPSSGNILEVYEDNNVLFNFSLENINFKNLDYTFKNGILEVVLSK